MSGLESGQEPLSWEDEGLPPPRGLVAPPDNPEPEQNGYRPLLPGGEFILSASYFAEPIWGTGEEILWAAREPLLICAPPGAGKTTIAQQLCLARIRGGDVLGFPVRKSREKVLYVAADRPFQSARSWRRMVDSEDELLLNAQLVVAREARLSGIAALAQRASAETVFIDTLGAVTGGVDEGEGGLRIYQALQSLIAAGLEVCILHHARKQGPERKPMRLDDVYGSQWLGAAVGSALMIEKQSAAKGFLRQEKSPAEPLYLRIFHDHRRGHTGAERWEPSDGE